MRSLRSAVAMRAAWRAFSGPSASWMPTRKFLVEFARHADPGADGPPYLQQPWGAYGAAYASQLFEIGIYAVAKDPQIPVPSPEFGEALAGASFLHEA